MSIGTTIAVSLNVLAIPTALIFAGMYYESQDNLQRQEMSNLESAKQAQQASDKRAADINAKLGAQIAERDNRLMALEQSIWATHDSEVEAIVKAAMFRKDHTDVPQPKEGTKSVRVGVKDVEYVVLFPAETESLTASDAKFDQALRDLAVVGRVSCEQGVAYNRGYNCYGSDAVGKRQIRMAL